MSKRPLIGLTLDSEPAGGWSKLPWYALRQNYFAAVIEAGGLPVALPHHPELALAYLERLDGVLVTGGAFDVDPALWGEEAVHPTVTLKPGRTDFELAVTRAGLLAHVSDHTAGNHRDQVVQYIAAAFDGSSSTRASVLSSL